MEKDDCPTLLKIYDKGRYRHFLILLLLFKILRVYSDDICIAF